MSFFNVYPLPELASEESLKGGTAVVVDILRATTTMTFALNSGAKRVIPCLTTQEAFDLRAKMIENSPHEPVLLGGERQGVLIEGFDLGNSPEDFTPEKVAEKTILFSTTNGTRTIFRALTADIVYIACFANTSAMLPVLLNHGEIHVICAGTDQQYTEEDMLFAGCLADRISLLTGEKYQLNVQAVVAREMWRQNFSPEKQAGDEPIHPEHLAGILRKSRGGKTLMQLGLGRDILAASGINTCPIVSLLNKQTMELTRQ